MDPRTSAPFLTACWNSLAFLNYAIAPKILAPYVPRGTELDSWQGRTLASVVGFRFTDTVVRGVAFPFHRNFTEINLRFYVRRVVDGEVRRGVVFVKEIVPLPAIAFVARALYNEQYVSRPMRFEVDGTGARYGWKHGARWNALTVRTAGSFASVESNSEEEFVTEHYWGYARARDGSTNEYRVEHPAWKVARASDAALDCDVASAYGRQFVDTFAAQPVSAFFADGSAVSVSPAARLHVPPST